MEEQFPEVVGISHYEKLWTHLDKRELRDFGSTKKMICERERERERESERER